MGNFLSSLGSELRDVFSGWEGAAAIAMMPFTLEPLGAAFQGAGMEALATSTTGGLPGESPQGGISLPAETPIPMPGGAECMIVKVEERTKNLNALAKGFLESVTPWSLTHDVVCTPPRAPAGSGIRRGVAPVQKASFSDALGIPFPDPRGPVTLEDLFFLNPLTALPVLRKFVRGEGATVDVSRVAGPAAGGRAVFGGKQSPPHRRTRFPKGCPTPAFYDAFTEGVCR